MPPPAQGLTSRFIVGPALRTQPDRRLVALVREGYEQAFDEIVRRYAKPLGRYAASIVGGRSEDVTQDAFSKALVALRRDGNEIELRPWLYRIVRNTALNDLRDRPPAPEVLAEGIVGGQGTVEEAERKEEIVELVTRLRALPEPQRAAIVMRELEGLSHDEIAAALGMSGGAARQVIYRARQALRDGAALLLPAPLLRLLLDHGAEVATGAGVSGVAIATTASAGGAGAGGALKLGALVAILASSVGTGVVLHKSHHHPKDSTGAAVESTQSSSPFAAPPPSSLQDTSGGSSSGSGEDGHGGSGHKGGDDNGGQRGRNSGKGGHQGQDHPEERQRQPGEAEEGPSEPDQPPHREREGEHGGQREQEQGPSQHGGPGPQEQGTSRPEGQHRGPGGGELEEAAPVRPPRDSNQGPGGGEGSGGGSGSGSPSTPVEDPPPEAPPRSSDGSGGSGSGSGHGEDDSL